MASWPSGEMDITFYKQASPMVECHPEGHRSESPSSIHCPLAICSLQPQGLFWLCMLTDETSSESPVLTLVLLLSLGNRSRSYSFHFCEFRMTKIKNEGERGHVLVTGCGTSVPLCYGLSCLWAQLSG